MITLIIGLFSFPIFLLLCFHFQTTEEQIVKSVNPPTNLVERQNSFKVAMQEYFDL